MTKRGESLPGGDNGCVGTQRVFEFRAEIIVGVDHLLCGLLERITVWRRMSERIHFLVGQIAQLLGQAIGVGLHELLGGGFVGHAQFLRGCEKVGIGRLRRRRGRIGCAWGRRKDRCWHDRTRY